MELKEELRNADTSTTDDRATTPQPCKPSRLRRVMIGLAVFVGVLVMIGVGLVITQNWLQSRAFAQQGNRKGPDVVIPDSPPAKVDEAPPVKIHPVEPALQRANEALAYIRQNIRDFSAIVTKLERQPDGSLREESMFLKIRHRQVDTQDKLVTPFSVYLKYLKPKNLAGREVIWVEGANDGNLIAHEPGLFNLIRFHLPPKGPIAMINQRYPIWEIGLENLIQQLLNRGEGERQHEECDVQFISGAKVDEISCTLIQIKHAEQKPEYKFHLARIFIDEQRNIPLRHSSCMWPAAPGEAPPIDEEYTYQDVKLNIGLTDTDFDPDNPEYNYP